MPNSSKKRSRTACVRRGTLVVWLGLWQAACVSGSIPPRPDAGDESPRKPSADAAAAEMCPASSETNACFQCTDERCCEEYAKCHDDPRCGTYYKTCIPECTGKGKSYPSCVIECDSHNGAGHAVYAPYHACGELHCLAPCSKKTADPCIQCMFAACPDEAYACDADSACDLLDACMTNCLGSTNYDACAAACNKAASPGVQKKYNLRNTCALTYCQEACAPGAGTDAGAPAQSMPDAGSSSNPMASQTCADGARVIYQCCQMSGSQCDSQDSYETCCLGTSCTPNSPVARQIGCLAGQSAASIESCATAFTTCGVGSSQ